MEVVAPIVAAALGAAAGVVSSLAVKRSSVVSVSQTIDVNDLIDKINALERRVNTVVDENRELRARLAALELWVRAQGHDPDLIALGQHLRDGHNDLDEKEN